LRIDTRSASSSLKTPCSVEAVMRLGAISSTRRDAAVAQPCERAAAQRIDGGGDVDLRGEARNESRRRRGGRARVSEQPRQGRAGAAGLVLLREGDDEPSRDLVELGLILRRELVADLDEAGERARLHGERRAGAGDPHAVDIDIGAAGRGSEIRRLLKGDLARRGFEQRRAAVGVENHVAVRAPDRGNADNLRQAGEDAVASVERVGRSAAAAAWPSARRRRRIRRRRARRNARADPPPRGR
jgi:hypothetical protein